VGLIAPTPQKSFITTNMTPRFVDPVQVDHEVVER
jgi:hypothetical protein